MIELLSNQTKTVVKDLLIKNEIQTWYKSDIKISYQKILVLDGYGIVQNKNGCEVFLVPGWKKKKLPLKSFNKKV